MDTCPSEEVFRSFFALDGPMMASLEKHGLRPTRREDYPVIRAYGAHARVDQGEASG